MMETAMKKPQITPENKAISAPENKSLSAPENKAPPGKRKAKRKGGGK
jgi:hypothetical protein